MSTQPQAAQMPPAEQEKLNQLLQKLTASCTTLALKVATCKCTTKDNCGIYEKAREISEVIDELVAMRPEAVPRAGSGGAS